MTNLFRNSSPGALTLKQSVEQAKKRLIERGLQMRQARALAAKGRGGDTEIAHVTPGEIILPKAFQTAAVLGAIREAAAEANIPLDRLRIGSPANSINPETGMPEFDMPDDVDGIALDPLEQMETPSALQDQGLPREVARTLPHRADMISAMQNPNVQAGLDLIRQREGAGLNEWTGHERFPMPGPNSGHPGFNSNGQSAAGPFQIQQGTFNDMQKKVGPMNFLEPDQNLATTAYLDNLHALEPLRNGDVDGFLNNASRSDGWASLPPYGEQRRGMSVDQAKALYDQFLRNRMGK